MGAAVSKNVTKQTINAIVSVTSQEILKVNNGTNINQLIEVSNTGGNVTIEGNVLNAVATLNMSALATALNDTDAKQNLQDALSQSSKALVKDINLLNVSDAENLVDSLITESTSIANNLTTTCESLFSSNQSIIVDTTAGNVSINNNILQSLTNVFQDCVSKQVSQNKVLNDIQTQINQSSEASTLGFSIWGVVAILAFVVVGILAVVVGPAFIPLIASGGKAGLLVGLVFMIIGAIFLLIWWFWSKRQTKISLWARPLEDDCRPVTVLSVMEYTSAQAAQDACTANKACKGFYFDATTFKATLYSSLSDKCQVRVDDRPITRKRRVYVSAGPAYNFAEGLEKQPVPTWGDLWINTLDAQWQERFEVGWSLAAQLHPAVNSIANFIGFVVRPISPQQSRYYPVQRSQTWDMYSTDDLEKYSFRQTGTETSPDALIIEAEGRGITTRGMPPPNVAGLAFNARKSWMLYVGIGFTALGVIMATFLGFKGAAKKLKKPPRVPKNGEPVAIDKKI